MVVSSAHSRVRHPTITLKSLVPHTLKHHWGANFQYAEIISKNFERKF